MPFPLGWYQCTTSSPLDTHKKNITTGNPRAPHHLQPEEKLDVSPCTALLTLLPFLTIMWAILDEEQPESPFTLFTKLVLQNSQVWEKQDIESPVGALFPVSSHSHTLLIHTHTPAICFFGFTTICYGMEMATGGQRCLQEVQRQ